MNAYVSLVLRLGNILLEWWYMSPKLGQLVLANRLVLANGQLVSANRLILANRLVLANGQLVSANRLILANRLVLANGQMVLSNRLVLANGQLVLPNRLVLANIQLGGSVKQALEQSVQICQTYPYPLARQS